MKTPSLDTGSIVIQPARKVHNYFQFWWHKVPEPRMVSMITGVAYFLMFATGVITVIIPPRSVSAVYGGSLMQVVGYLLLIGAFIGIISGIREFWQLERVGIGAQAVGAITYFYIVIQLQIEADSGSRFTQMGFILAALMFLALRLSLIWKYPYKPRG